MNRLCDLLDKNLFTPVPLNTIKHACCVGTTIPAYDFDAIKDHFCDKVLGLTERLKSVDALVVAPSKKLLFVEMKRYSQKGPFNMKDYIDGHLQEEEMPHKIVDSLLLLLSICGYFGIDPLFYKHILENRPPKIKPILLVNLNYRDYAKYKTQIDIYTKISFTKRVNHIAVLDCKSFNTLFPSL